MKGKAIFTDSEVSQIIALIREKVISESSKQVSIRNKIRKLGFNASDFNIGGGYNEQDFLRVIEVNNKSVEKKTLPKKDIYFKKESLIEKNNSRQRSDEYYIIDLCDHVLKLKASRQHRFDFLRGDTGVRLPIDAYYPKLKLAIEYLEKQHTEEVRFFDKRQTASGMCRGDQRKLYDQRRKDLLPAHGITLVEISYADFDFNKSKRLVRNMKKDIKILQEKLKRES